MFIVTLFLLAFGGICALSLKRPGAALALVVCLPGLDQALAANSAFFGSRTSLVNLAVGAMSAVTLGAALLSGKARFRARLRLLPLAVVGFVIWVGLATEWSSYRGAFGLLQPAIPYIALQIVVAPLLLQRVDDARAALRLSSWLSASIAVYVAFDASVWMQGTRRLALSVAGQSDLVSNPLALGDMGAVAFILAVLRPGFQRFQRPTTWLRYGICLVALFVTAQASRGETVAAVAAATTLYLLSGVRRAELFSRPVVMVVVGLLTGLVMTSVLESEVGLRYQEASLLAGLEARRDLIGPVWERFIASPDAWLLGLGTNASLSVSQAYPHNHIVQVLTETGVVGLLVWLLIVGGVATSGFRALRLTQSDEEERLLVGAMLALFVYHLLLGFKRGTMLAPEFFMQALLVDRLLVALRERLEPEARDRTEPIVLHASETETEAEAASARYHA